MFENFKTSSKSSGKSSYKSSSKSSKSSGSGKSNTYIIVGVVGGISIFTLIFLMILGMSTK